MTRLPGDYVPPSPPQSRPGRLHGFAIALMTISAVIGSLALLAFITVGWLGEMGRTVIAIVVIAAVVFMASGAIAVFAAARDTYARDATRKER